MFPKPFGRAVFYAFAVMLATSLLSAGTYYVPAAYATMFWALALGMLVLCIWKLDWAILSMFGELLVGSQGHVFEVTVHGFSLSIRLVWFLLLTVTLFIRLLRQHRLRDILDQPGSRWLLGFIAVIIFGALYGYFRGNMPSNVFFDTNAFLFLGLTLVLVPQIKDLIRVDQLMQVFVAGIVFLAMQTALLLATFSHQYKILPSLYHWLRNTRTFEITPYAKNFFRIFSQSQIYSMFGFFFAIAALPWFRSRQMQTFLLWILALTSGTLLLSFSRSMWVGLLITGAIAVIWFLRRFGWNGKVVVKTLLAGCALLIAELLVISFLANFPYIWNRPGGQSAFSLFSERSTTTQDVAAASRYEQIQPLLKAIAKHPILGSGFGTVVSYTSHDPRIVAATGGLRTTFAFEWGYLDLLLKIGLLGVAVLVGWIVQIFRAIRKELLHAQQPYEKTLFLGLLLSVVALVITHATTPYINHPLGLGLLTLASGLSFHRRSQL